MKFLMVLAVVGMAACSSAKTEVTDTTATAKVDTMAAVQVTADSVKPDSTK